MSSEVTIKALKDLCDEIIKKRADEDEADNIAKRLGKERSELESKLILMLEENSMRGFDFEDAGKRLGIRETFQLATPKGEDKEVFFGYLKSIGHFDALATVHAKTLASWYNSENEAAIARGEPGAFIPGLELPTKRKSIAVTKL